MSITIGIYDLFAYTIPGLLYLFVIYEALRRFRLVQVGISDIPDISSGIGLLVLVMIAVAAHLLGHMMDFFAHLLVFRLLRHKSLSAKALQELKERYPNTDIRFEARDWNLLFTLLRERSHDHACVMDPMEANSIMLRNICLGLFVLVLLQIYSLITDYSTIVLVVTIGAAILGLVAWRQSHKFHQWFAAEIFEASLNYGHSLNEVVHYQSQKEESKAQIKTKTKPSRK